MDFRSEQPIGKVGVCLSNSPRVVMVALHHVRVIAAASAGQHPDDVAGVLQAAEGKPNALLDAFDKRFGFTREPGS